MNKMTFGEKITLLRTRKKLSKKALAEAAGLHWVSISKYERNETEPYADALKRLASTLGVSADYLLFDEMEILPTINDKELLQEMTEADKLDEANRTTLKNIIRSFLGNQQLAA